MISVMLFIKRKPCCYIVGVIDVLTCGWLWCWTLLLMLLC